MSKRKEEPARAPLTQAERRAQVLAARMAERVRSSREAEAIYEAILDPRHLAGAGPGVEAQKQAKQAQVAVL